MQDHIPDMDDPLAALKAHVAAMAESAGAIETILGRWAQQQCASAVQAAVTQDVQHSRALRAAGRYDELMREAAKLGAELPERIEMGLRTTAWRHLYVDPNREGTGRIMADLDYGIWQESGHKIPPAYEPVVRRELERVTQLLRRFGYRPDLMTQVAKRRYTAPPEATAAMETYCRLAARLCDVLAGAESAARTRRSVSDVADEGTWGLR